MAFGDFIKKTINVVGVVTKVSVEIGTEMIGSIAEKIDDNPQSRDKIISYGKNLGQNIKKSTNEMAENTVDVMDSAVATSIKTYKNISDSLTSKINDVTKKYHEKQSNTNTNSYDNSNININSNSNIYSSGSGSSSSKPKETPRKYDGGVNNDEMKAAYEAATGNRRVTIDGVNFQLLKEIKWENSFKGIRECENPNTMDDFNPLLYDGSQFYLTYYICTCESHLLYKIKLRNYYVLLEGKETPIFNIFTCPTCGTFYASIHGKSEGASFSNFYTSLKLSEFALVSRKYDEPEYSELVHNLERICKTK